MLLRATNFKSVVSADSTTIPIALLPIVLDDAFAANVSDARILAGVAACTALTQEVPKLVELHGDGIETRAVVVRQLAVLSVLQQMMFLFDETLDMVAYLAIVHGRNPLRVSEPARTA